MAKDLFWEKVRQNLVEAGVLVENKGSNGGVQDCQMLFRDQEEGQGITISPWFVLRMCVERSEV